MNLDSRMAITKNVFPVDIIILEPLRRQAIYC